MSWSKKEWRARYPTSSDDETENLTSPRSRAVLVKLPRSRDRRCTRTFSPSRGIDTTMLWRRPSEFPPPSVIGRALQNYKLFHGMPEDHDVRLDELRESSAGIGGWAVMNGESIIEDAVRKYEREWNLPEGSATLDQVMASGLNLYL